MVKKGKGTKRPHELHVSGEGAAASDLGSAGLDMHPDVSVRGWVGRCSAGVIIDSYRQLQLVLYHRLQDENEELDEFLRAIDAIKLCSSKIQMQ